MIDSPGGFRPVPASGRHRALGSAGAYLAGRNQHRKGFTMTKTLQAAKTGRLVSVGVKRLGAFRRFEYFACVDCGTEYPREDFRPITCNGAPIGRCPWCCPDSEPFKNGRGK